MSSSSLPERILAQQYRTLPSESSEGVGTITMRVCLCDEELCDYDEAIKSCPLDCKRYSQKELERNESYYD